MARWSSPAKNTLPAWWPSDLTITIQHSHHGPGREGQDQWASLCQISYQDILPDTPEVWAGISGGWPGLVVLTSFLMFYSFNYTQSVSQLELIDLMNISLSGAAAGRAGLVVAEFSCVRSVITVLRSRRKTCRHACQALPPHWSATSHLVGVLSSDWLDCWHSATPVTSYAFWVLYISSCCNQPGLYWLVISEGQLSSEY